MTAQNTLDSIEDAIQHERARRSTTRAVGEELFDPHIYDDQEDPHRAAHEDVDVDVKVSISTWITILFINFTFQSSLISTLLTVFPIIVLITLELQGSTLSSNWMASADLCPGAWLLQLRAS
ncbi:hypothetical protein NA57DRAFT_74730 [Rhizodiscina lignyota]|uniref:Uncharacterized protein n=1 Tax=Rhizodiscina lignyota TaxID=1504668 RepID=A0A9P4IHI3_9PEZI|nr:hypothetical protein NA57DRAFT_74730 [Rhizodiscina lignyota]